MKVLYVDTQLSGHHLRYLQALENEDSVCLIPETDEKLKSKVIKWRKTSSSYRISYLQRMLYIKKIADQEKPDVIHFLYGDYLYRFFGIFMNLFGKYRTVVTFHWMKTGFFQKISTRRLCRRIDSAVVHSGYIKDYFMSLGVKNVEHIEYPVFEKHREENPKAYWNIPDDAPLIACIGNTRNDKGLDILLNALKKLDPSSFRLLVAGKAEMFDENYIAENTKGMNVTTHLSYLSDEELNYALSAADIICLPYRKIFNGASGPLTEGASLGKCIVGSDHGNLGNTITSNHLGYVFKAEDEDDLAATLKEILPKKFEPDETYKAFQEKLDVDSFKKHYEELFCNLTNKK